MVFFRLRSAALRRLPAVFTVEASLLMAILLPCLLSLIYLGYLDHDRGVLTASACECAARSDRELEEDKAEDDLKRTAQELGRASVLATEDPKVSFSRNKDTVQVSYTGSLKVPAFVRRLFGQDRLSCSRSFSRKLFHPTSVIRRIRGLQDLCSLLQEEKGGAP